MSWSEGAWKKIEPIYQSIIEMPFILELMDGTLAADKFQFYMAQDAHYLEHFGRALAVIGARALDTADALAFMRFAENAIVVEAALHESYFREFGLEGRGKIEPACHHYIHFLKCTAALDIVEVGMAAVLPCFWIYKEVGDYIYNNRSSITNPYQRWIDTYAGEEFGIVVKNAIQICDRAAEATVDPIINRMDTAFITATHLEFDFWNAAYNQRQW
ncbi:thiaminase II [Olivibacter sp. SDN3]|uniref:thiaminase II n=1 Tax=Olivibacter sp. SDN3 TaxID=2764720 RepID=UPI001650E3E7|nr:thiaminase II [Olivibacter sp. SDN3]QNL49027.1 thiaminase II [Olivibacter sp. SDN3]